MPRTSRPRSRPRSARATARRRLALAAVTASVCVAVAEVARPPAGAHAAAACVARLAEHDAAGARIVVLRVGTDCAAAPADGVPADAAAPAGATAADSASAVLWTALDAALSPAAARPAPTAPGRRETLVALVTTLTLLLLR